MSRLAAGIPIRALLMVTLCGFTTMAQPQSVSPATAPQSFETASLRLVASGEGGLTSVSPWGSHQFRATNISLGNLLSMAYGVDPRYIKGIPAQLEDAEYTIAATASGDQGLTYEQIHAPLQKLLAERLHLAAHTTMTQASGYQLTVAKKGPRLTPAKAEEQPYVYLFANEIKAQSVTLGSFADMLTRIVEQPVKDATGIGGKYDFDLHFARLDQQDSDQPSPFTALEEQYGLKLVSSKVDVLSLVVDHVDLTPAEN
ncbi:TIGR03435 family protein [Terracidiphilus sp.]|jgi:uncharacterized protein (TIGR03435 family)|uniref:TIGR03435 family protein n=1 Tax=Terracidiphilus sp. TaxID=1964191 RepID=UPI003C24C380